MKKNIFNYLRIFFETGVFKNIQNKIHRILVKRANVCLFLGYTENYLEETYKMLNIVTKKVLIIRDIKWLNRMYEKHSEEKLTAIVHQEDFDISVEDAKRKENNGNKIMNELIRLQTFYNLTLTEMNNID